MKCLTICQPHASYILAPELPAGVERKRVENRAWQLKHRGPLLIHAGKSGGWLTRVPLDRHPTWMPFGMILGAADVIDCVQFDPFSDPYLIHFRDTHAWLPTHGHTCGPWCIVLENHRRFPNPIPYKGRQGLFEVPDEVVSEQLKKAVPV